MILDITIKNYRSFKEEVNFSLKAESSKSKSDNVFQTKCGSDENVRLLKTAMIYGANASGKSNLLKAMFDIVNLVCHSTTKAGENVFVYDSFKFNTETINKPVEFSIEFIGKDSIKYKYDICFDSFNIIKEELNYYPLNRSKNLFSRKFEGDKDEIIHTAKLGVDFNNKEIEIFHNQTVLSKFGEEIPNKIITEVYIYIKNIDVINACSSRRISMLNREVTNDLNANVKLLKRLMELIKFADTGIVNLNLEEVDFPEDFPDEIKSELLDKYKYQINGIHKRYSKSKFVDKVPLPLDQESHGTNILYSLGGKILKSLDRGTPLFVDEICSGLHIYLIRVLIGLFQNERINPKNAQLIFTSHNTDLLDKMLFRKDQIWFAEKNQYGESDLYCLQDFADVREDTPFDKWYLAGKFGGVPNLKSIESLFL